jgi:hypothetical protein
MTDAVDKRLFAKAKRKALGNAPYFALSDETREAMSTLRMLLGVDLERLQGRWDGRSEKYRDEDPHGVSAWLEDIGNLADTLEEIDEAAPEQRKAVDAALAELRGEE